jgi:hypothetical protein
LFTVMMCIIFMEEIMNNHRSVLNQTILCFNISQDLNYLAFAEEILSTFNIQRIITIMTILFAGCSDRLMQNCDQLPDSRLPFRNTWGCWSRSLKRGAAG